MDNDLYLSMCSNFVSVDEYLAKAIANGPVGQVSAGSLFFKVKTKFLFTKFHFTNKVPY